MTKTPTPQRDDPPPAADAAAQDADANGLEPDADALKAKSIAELARMGRGLFGAETQPPPSKDTPDNDA